MGNSFQVLIAIAAMMAPILAAPVDPEMMFQAVSEGKFESVKTLLEEGGQTTWATPEEGYSLLHLAGGPKMAQLLLDNGAKLEARDKNGMTPLHRAAWTANTGLCLSIWNKVLTRKLATSMERHRSIWLSRKTSKVLSKYSTVKRQIIN